MKKDLEETFNYISKEYNIEMDRRRKEQVREVLEYLDYVYIHGDKYVAIKDVIDLF